MKPLSKRKRIKLRFKIQHVKCPACRFQTLCTDRFGKITCAYCGEPYKKVVN